MIKVNRCPEPGLLVAVRGARLPELRALGREPVSKEIEGYKVVAEHLWSAQHFKCCYCESKIPKGFNDVEHYRPKAEADRNPGSTLKHGYWWLAFDWTNLLFACPGCNRSGKNSQFPLAAGSQPLIAEVVPPGAEDPLLIDPGADTNPVEHIQFVYAPAGGPGTPAYWWARPRNGSVRGNVTIEVCKLNRLELRELRSDYVSNIVEPHANAINVALRVRDKRRANEEYERAIALLSCKQSFVCLAFDVLRFLVPDAQLRSLIRTGWPAPENLI